MANEFKVKNGLIVDQGGASITGSSTISGSLALNSSGSNVFTVDGTSGRLFSIDDSLSGSLFSVNTAAGLPIIEAFSDNTVRVGQFGQKALFVSQSSVGIGKESSLGAKLDISGSVLITGSLNVSSGITGSLFGTSSWAISSSAATTSSYAQSSSIAVTASYALTASFGANFTASNILVNGTLTAQTLVVQTITSSIEYSSGSNIFGSQLSNTQQLTGSVSVTGSLSVNGSSVVLSNQTSSMSVLTSSFAISSSRAVSSSYAATSSWALNSISASYAPTPSNVFLQSGNSFGTTATLGTNDNNMLQFETNGIIRSQLYNDGNIRILTSASMRPFMDGFYADVHPEGDNPAIIPYLGNDIAYLTLKGGSFTGTPGSGSTYVTTTDQIESLFDGAPTYAIFDSVQLSGSYTASITFPQSYQYGNIIGFSFGLSSWRAKDFTVEILVTGSYYTLDTVSNWQYANYNKYFNYAGQNVQGARITFSNFASLSTSGFRVADIFLLNYNSQYGKAIYLGRDGGQIYKGITVTGSLVAAGGVTGSLKGTASLATTASYTLTASYAATASYALTVATASLTGSFVTLDTTQTITGAKTINNVLNVNDYLYNTVTKTITGSTNESPNIYYVTNNATSSILLRRNSIASLTSGGTSIVSNDFDPYRFETWNNHSTGPIGLYGVVSAIRQFTSSLSTQTAAGVVSSVIVTSGSKLDSFTAFKLSTGIVTPTGTLTSVTFAHGTGVSSSLVDSYFGLVIPDGTTNVTYRGLYLSVASGSGKHNIYSDGTADNYLAGALGIGTNSLVGYNLAITRTITGSLYPISVYAGNNIQSGSSIGYGFLSSIGTAASPLSIQIRHFQANQGTKGAGSTISTQYGFFVDPSMNTGNSNVGFYGGLAASSSFNWNLSMSGDAPNYLAGALGIGSTSLTGYTLRIGKNITGATSTIGVIQEGTVQSDVTSVVRSFRSTLLTAATSFTLTDYVHFDAHQSTIGGGSSVTNQYGYFVQSSLTGATNNYGFYGGIASGSGRWNLYMGGDASNYLAGALGIGTTTINPGNSIHVQRALTGATSLSSIYNDATVVTDVTGTVHYYNAYLNTQNAVFTVNTVTGFNAGGAGSFGSATVTNQIGFYAQSSLTGATFNFGFYGNIASGSGRYNIYMGGTADNYLAGSTGIGTTSLTGYNLAVGKNLTGGTTNIAGIVQNGSVQSDVTALAIGIWNIANTQATAFTLSELRHFSAYQNTFGAGSSVTTQTGYYVSSTLTGASNNYAFYGGLATSGSRNWNLYMAGTADNYLAGGLGIGTTSLTGYNLHISKNITGATTAYGVYLDSTIQSDVTNAVWGIRTNLTTAATSFTLGNLVHFAAVQGTIGAGSSVTTQYGYYINSGLVGANTNYGFFSDVPASGSRNWNIYMQGTAPNYLAGALAIGTTTTSSALLTVQGNVYATSFTGSLLGTASWATNTISASYAATASYVNTLNQSVIITGSLAVGTSSLGANENTLVLGPSPAGGIGEGGQLILQSPNSGGYTSASMWDNYQNSTRLLRGSNAGSDAVVAQFNMHTKQVQFPQYNSTTAFTGTTLVGLLGFDANGNLLTTTTSSGGGGGGVSITNNTDNYILTATGVANSINGESNLQFNGSTLTVNGNVTATSITSSGAVIAQANGQMYFRGGDDAELWDINVTNTVGLYGQQDQTVGSLKLGSGGGTISGRSGSIGIGTVLPVSGTLHVNGNVFATSYTGSLFGTASWATNFITSSVTSASYAATSSWALNFITSSVTSASYAATSSWALNFITSSVTSASYAATSSNVLGGTPSYVPIWNTSSSLANSVIYQSSSNVLINTTNINVINGSSQALAVNGSLGSTKYILGSDLSLIPISGNQSAITTWWGMQLIGNKQSNIDYTPTAIGANSDFSVIIPNQQASKIGLIIKGQTGQTGNLLEFRDINNSGSSAFNSSGFLSLGKTTATSTLDVSGSALITGSLTVSQGITGSHFGTSSWAISSSYALTASYYGGSIATSSYATNVSGGAANYIPLWNSATTLTSSAMYQSASNIGIGTTTPSYKLDVNGSTRIYSTGLYIEQTTGYSPSLYLNQNGTVQWQLMNTASIGNFEINDGNSTKLAISRSGNVGIGTTAPTSKLHVVADTATLALTSQPGITSQFVYPVDGRTLVRVENNSGNASAGATAAGLSLLAFSDVVNNPATNRHEAQILLGAKTSAQDGSLKIIAPRDLNFYINSQNTIMTGSSYNYYGTLAASISSSGNFGIGTATPAYTLDVNGTARVTSLIETSTRTLKTDIQPYSTNIELVKQLEPVSFTWKDTGKSDVGLIAEDVEKLFPEFVSKTDSGEVTGINYGKLSTIFINVFKEQQKRIEELEDKIKKLTS